MTVAEVLLPYLQAKLPSAKRPRELKAQIGRLNESMGNTAVSEISRSLCQDYVAQRGVTRGAAVELAYLKAAINHATRERIILYSVPIWMPPANRPRERWLTRSEMARLLWAAWRYRETQKGAPGRYTRRHIAMFILMGRYTGTRPGAICAASFEPIPGRGWVDLENGVYHRASDGEASTKKRKPPIKLPPQLFSHLRRWKARRPEAQHIVEWRGEPVRDVKKGFAATRKAAGLDERVTPHSLRHTAISWAMQSGADRWEVAGYFGVTMQMIEEVYGHHAPDSGGTVHRALSAKRSAERSAPPRLQVVSTT